MKNVATISFNLKLSPYINHKVVQKSDDVFCKLITQNELQTLSQALCAVSGWQYNLHIYI